MLDWIPVSGSERIVAEAYDAEEERIYVRFPNDVEWWYGACPPDVWEEFTAPGQSRGTYIAQVLNYSQTVATLGSPQVRPYRGEQITHSYESCGSSLPSAFRAATG